MEGSKEVGCQILTRLRPAVNEFSVTALSCRAPADGFVFDSEVIAQMAAFGFRIAKIPVETRYFREASSIRLFASCRYGLETLLTLVKFLLHRLRLRSFPQFQQ